VLAGRTGNTGVFGGPDVQAIRDMRRREYPGQNAPAPEEVPAAISASAPAQHFIGAGGSWDMGKFANPEHTTAKYQVGRVLDRFDPSQGVTPEVIEALNALGLAEYYGSGDKAGYRNVTDAGRAAGIKDDGFAGDWVKNFTGEGEKRWRYAAPGQAERDAGGQGGGMGMARGGMSPFDPMRQMMLPADDSTYQRLVARLQQMSGGGLENDALRALL
jgi:hypothetical protein